MSVLVDDEKNQKLLLLVKKILEKFLFIGEMTHIGIKRKIFELFNVLRNGPNYRLKKLLNELEIVCFVAENVLRIAVLCIVQENIQKLEKIQIIKLLSIYLIQIQSEMWPSAFVQEYSRNLSIIFRLFRILFKEKERKD